MTPDIENPSDVELTGYEIATHHRAIADALMKVEEGSIKRLIISCPPRHGKTRLASHLFGAWFAGRNPGKHLILGTYNEKFSWDHGRNIRKLVRSALFKQVFSDVSVPRGTAAVDRMETSTHCVLQFVGRSGTITGRGADLIIIDDPIKNRREADSPVIRQQLWDWYVSDITSRRMTKDAAIIIIQTRWHEDDLIGRLTDPTNPSYTEEQAKDWYIVDLPAIAGDSDPLGRAPGEVLWPKRFDFDFFDQVAKTDARAFQALYQGSPAPDDGVFIRADWLETYNSMKELPPEEELRFYCSSDHAVSTQQDRDATCLLTVALDKDQNLWVMPDIFWERKDTGVVVEAMLQMMERHKPLFWFAERGHISKSIGPFLRKRMLERSIFCTIDEIVPTADKQTRAQSIQARMSLGKVKWPAFARWWPAAHSQLLKFPRGVNDDLVDAIALIGLGLQKQFSRREAPKPRVDAGANVMTFGSLMKNSNRARRAERAARDLRGW